MCSSRWICERQLKLMRQLCGRGTNLLVWQLLPYSGDQWFNRPFASFVKTREGYDKIPAFLKEGKKKKAHPGVVLLLYQKRKKRGSDYRWKGFLLFVSFTLEDSDRRPLGINSRTTKLRTRRSCWILQLPCHRLLWRVQWETSFYLVSPMRVFSVMPLFYFWAVPLRVYQWWSCVCVCVRVFLHMQQVEDHDTHFPGWSWQLVEDNLRVKTWFWG